MAECLPKRKVLYVVHNHPSVRPGGVEVCALELYEAMRASDEFEPILLARSGPSVSTVCRTHEETLLSPVDQDGNQYFFYTDPAEFDAFTMTSRNKDIYTRHFHEFLAAYQPDVVHFQHTLLFGYDILRQTRNTLPHAPIVYTLHEFLPMCHNNGLMVRTNNRELCVAASPRHCHECFPDKSPQSFFRRKRFIQSHFALVDLFLAPSHFLIQRYVDWGIPPERIRYLENGRPAVQTPVVSEDEDGMLISRPQLPSQAGTCAPASKYPRTATTDPRPRNRIAFFGQFTEFKGVDVLLKAMKILGEEDQCDVHLWLHGANLEWQGEPFQDEIRALLESTKQTVTLAGRYTQAELPRLMANIDWVIVPSIWWENAPLVIQEAFLYERPVICSDIGGMAEKVTHGVNGLHFRVGDPFSLARTIRQAVSSSGLWETLRSRIPAVYKVEDQVTALAEMYRTLLDVRERGANRA